MKYALIFAAAAFARAHAQGLGLYDGVPRDGGVHVLHVRGPIYMLVGAGGNITV
ncbi:MAG: hypothetical protein JO099_03645, partial [Acidobacteriia bacterium]|nr:hypothetical protein [Terriglobia bacterium]